MPKKKSANTSKSVPIKDRLEKIGLAVVKIQETLDDALPTLATLNKEMTDVKQRLGGVEEHLGNVGTELRRKPNREEIEAIVNREMNKAAEAMRINFEERDQKLKDQENLLEKLKNRLT